MKKLFLSVALAIVAITAIGQTRPFNPLTGQNQTAKIPDTAKAVTYTFTESELKAIYGAVTDAAPLLVKYPAANEKQAAGAFSVLSRLNSVAEYLTDKFNKAHEPKKQ